MVPKARCHPQRRTTRVIDYSNSEQKITRQPAPSSTALFSRPLHVAAVTCLLPPKMAADGWRSGCGSRAKGQISAVLTRRTPRVAPQR